MTVFKFVEHSLLARVSENFAGCSCGPKLPDQRHGQTARSLNRVWGVPVPRAKGA